MQYVLELSTANVYMKLSSLSLFLSLPSPPSSCSPPHPHHSYDPPVLGPPPWSQVVSGQSWQAGTGGGLSILPSSSRCCT